MIYSISMKVSTLILLLKKNYPKAECALHYSTPHELLISTILSAQCTDKRVNQVTPSLFQAFPSVEAFSKAPIRKLEHLIRSTGFYKNKARNIKACCQKLLKDHNGEVPKDIDELVKLPGVGRKTANVVLGNAFGIASGVVVDTHVTRLSYRMGLAQTKNPVILERHLNKLLPQKHWIIFSHWMIFHGRQVCTARNPDCDTCFLRSHCPKKKYTLR